MATRYVKATGKDRDGDITKLCNSGETWSSRSKLDAIRDIENNIHDYRVKWTSSEDTTIRVVNGSSGKYLRTDLSCH
ncbi:DUF3892 domain-containing protein [Ensifer sp. MPMI2T]|nr:DUF3892 domain-containing protein [Ensifer sp. MPMI2T]